MVIFVAARVAVPLLLAHPTGWAPRRRAAPPAALGSGRSPRRTGRATGRAPGRRRPGRSAGPGTGRTPLKGFALELGQGIQLFSRSLDR